MRMHAWDCECYRSVQTFYLYTCKPLHDPYRSSSNTHINSREEWVISKILYWYHFSDAHLVADGAQAAVRATARGDEAQRSRIVVDWEYTGFQLETASLQLHVDLPLARCAAARSCESSRSLRCIVLTQIYWQPLQRLYGLLSWRPNTPAGRRRETHSPCVRLRRRLSSLDARHESRFLLFNSKKFGLGHS